MSVPTPPEVAEAARVEEVARAIHGADDFPGPTWDGEVEGNREDYRRLAVAAVAAYRAAAADELTRMAEDDGLYEPVTEVRAQGGGAEEAWDEGYRAALLDADEQPYSDRPERATWRPRSNPHRAALAPQAKTGAQACAMCGAPDHREWAH